MKSRTTVILLVLFFAGLVGLWWADYAGVPTAEERRRLAGLVLPELREVEPIAVHRVEIAGGPEPGPLVFEHRPGSVWQMVAPGDVLAERPQVETLVRNLQALRRLPGTDPIAAPTDEDLARFGLDRPERVVRLFDAEGTLLAALELGRALPDQRYVRAAGHDGVEVVDAKLVAAVDLPARAWRERGLFTLSTFDIVGLDIQGPDRDLRAERADYRWRLIRPFSAPADDSQVEAVLADLTSLLRAVDPETDFVADDVEDFAPFGLDSPSWTITLTPEPESGLGPPQVVHVGTPTPEDDGWVYARRADQDDVLAVNAAVLRDLAADPIALRSREPADLSLTHVDFFVIESDGIEHRLGRGPDGWQVLAPSPGPADATVVGELLNRIDVLQAGQLLRPDQVARPGLDQPLAVIAVWENGVPRDGPDAATALPDDFQPQGEPVVVLKLGRFDAGNKVIYAQAEGEPILLALPEHALNLVPQGPLAYRDRTILDLRPDLIHRLELVRDGASFVLQPSRTGDGWRLVDPVEAPADPEAVAQILVWLSRLRAQRLVTDRPESLSAFGLDPPIMTLSWEPGPERSRQTLQIGGEVPETPGSRYATLDEQSLIFTLGADDLAILEAELRDRQLLAFAVEQAQRLVVRRGDRSESFTRRPATPGRPASWTPDADDPEARITPALDPSALESWVTALSDLRAERFTQYEGPFPAETGLLAPSLVLEVTLADGSGTRQLRVGRRTPDGSGARFAATGTEDHGPVAQFDARLPWNAWLNAAEPGDELPSDVFTPRE